VRFHLTLQVTASNATVSRAELAKITPSWTISPELNAVGPSTCTRHTSPSRAALAGVISFSGENRLPSSWLL